MKFNVVAMTKLRPWLELKKRTTRNLISDFDRLFINTDKPLDTKYTARQQ